MKFTNNHNLPAPLVYTIRRAVEMYEGPRPAEVLSSKRISVTTLINPPRITFLRAHHDADLEVDVSDLLYLVQGIAFHYMMAGISCEHESTAIAERRMERPLRGWRISGQFDTFADGVLADWKWTSVWAVLSPRFEWGAQLNLYRWLGKAHGIDATKLENWALLRDWSVAKAGRDKRMPECAFASVEHNIWSDEVVENYISNRLHVYELALSTYTTTNDPNATLLCSEEERWERKPGQPVRCASYCDVASWCAFGKVHKG